MLFLGFLIAFLLGYSILNLISTEFNIAEKLGFSFNIGIGLITFEMFLLNVLGIKITLPTVLIASVILIVASLGFNYKNIKSIINPTITWPKANQINFAWVLLFCIMTYVLWAMYQKAIYWPVVEYDSVTGYDFMGKAIAKEGSFNNSLVQNIGYVEAGRYIYPPLVSGSCAFMFLLGQTNSHLIFVVLFLSLLLSFYGNLVRYTNKFWAIFLTLIICITPEFLSHAALSLTNMPNAVFISLAVINVYIFIDKDKYPNLWLGSILLGLGVWTRTDSVAFIAACGLFIGFYSLKLKNLKPLIVFSAITGTFFLSWTAYVRYFIKANAESMFVNRLFWDSERISKIATYMNDYFLKMNDLYGGAFIISFWFLLINFFVIIFLVIIKIKSKNNNLNFVNFTTITRLIIGSSLKTFFKQNYPLIPLLLTSLFLYTLVYYQVNYSDKTFTLDGYMVASYKRGIFCFVPILLFIMGNNDLSKLIFDKLKFLK